MVYKRFHKTLGILELLHLMSKEATCYKGEVIHGDTFSPHVVVLGFGLI